MPSTTGRCSTRFRELYESLPQNAQQELAQRHLIPLLDGTSARRIRKAVKAVTQLRRRHRNIPTLDLKGKRADINFLLEELARDSKQSYVTDSSRRPQILDEVVSTLTDWLNDIWSVAYEYKVDYLLAHECLLFVCAALTRLANVRSGCKCSLTNVYIPVTLKSKSGRIIKTFHIDGVHNLESVMQFIWRDLFLSMLAKEPERHKQTVLGMLTEIESTTGSQGLVQILHGGRKFWGQFGYDNTTEDTTVSSEDWVDEDEDGDNDDDEEDEGTWEEDDFPRCRHWSSRIQEQMFLLRTLVQTAIKSAFEDCPSIPLYDSLIDISTDPDQMDTDLSNALKNIATASADAFAVALDIHSRKDRHESIIELLDSNPYLLRPRDYRSLQAATKSMANNSSIKRALTILEAEMMDTAGAIRRALLLSFPNLDDAANKTELGQILGMRNGAVTRRDRVEAWVDAISSPGANVPNAMLFALMIGMPPMPGMSPDDDPYTYLDLDPHDPDLADLRHEYRPAYKNRFESWADTGLTIKGGPPILLVVYKHLIETMPFLQATDVSVEMIARLSERPSKQHVCDGLDALLAFVKVQRRKYNLSKAHGRSSKTSEGQPKVHPGRSAAASSSGKRDVHSAPSSSLAASSTSTTLAADTASLKLGESSAASSSPSSTTPSAPLTLRPVPDEPTTGTSPQQEIADPGPLSLALLLSNALLDPLLIPGPSLDDVD